ncbi:MAG: type II toxin-antitoxin system HicB family antitoxin [Oscillospiraceae bacterium]
MMLVYPAIFHFENDSHWVEFPDLNGCHTYGTTLENTIQLAQEALGLYAATQLEQGKKLPKPSNIQNVSTDGNSFVSLIYCDANVYIRSSKSVKKTLTIPDWMNDLASENGINFSQTLQNALMEQLSLTKKD